MIHRYARFFMSAKNVCYRKVVIRVQTMVRRFQPSPLLKPNFFSLATLRIDSASPCSAALAYHLTASAKFFLTPFHFS